MTKFANSGQNRNLVPVPNRGGTSTHETSKVVSILIQVVSVSITRKGVTPQKYPIIFFYNFIIYSSIT